MWVHGVTKVALEQVCLRNRATSVSPGNRAPSVSPVSIIPPTLRIHSLIYQGHYIVLQNMTSLNNPLQKKTTTKQYKTNISGAILEVHVLLTAV